LLVLLFITYRAMNTVDTRNGKTSRCNVTHLLYINKGVKAIICIISIMRGKTSKISRMFLLAGIASVCALRWNMVHVVVAQEAAR